MEAQNRANTVKRKFVIFNKIIYSCTVISFIGVKLEDKSAKNETTNAQGY